MYMSLIGKVAWSRIDHSTTNFVEISNIVLQGLDKVIRKCHTSPT